MADETNVISFDRELSEKRRQADRDNEEVRGRVDEMRAAGVGPRPVNVAPARSGTTAEAAASTLRAPTTPTRATAAVAAAAAADQDAEARAKALAAVLNRYHKVKDQFYLKDPQSTPAFKDRGEKLVTNLHDATIARSMVDLARAKGWDTIKVSGSAEFKREVWLYASAQGMDVAGHKPTELDRVKLGELKDDVLRVIHNPSDQPQRAAPAATAAEHAAPAPAQAPTVQDAAEAAFRAIERRNTELMPIAKDGLSVADARSAVAEDVATMNSLLPHGDLRHFALVVIGDNARTQSAYAQELQRQAPDLAGDVRQALQEDERRMAAKEDRKAAGMPKLEVVTAQPAAAAPEQQSFVPAESDLPPPLTPRHEAALVAMRASMERSKHTPAQIEAAIEYTREHWTNDRVYVGRVVEHGAANYDFKESGSPSYFLRLEDPYGNRSLLWGVDLPRALGSAGAAQGEDLVVSFKGSQKVEVPVVMDGDGGRAVRYERVERNVWDVVPVRSLAPEQAKLAKSQAMRSQGPDAGAVKRALQPTPITRAHQGPVRAPAAARGR